VERAHLVGRESADDSVQHPAVVEQDEILLLPIALINK
jgi:hypothetical protein